MEKIIKNKKNLIIFCSFLLVLFLFGIYQFSFKQNKNEKYFDVILASLYNEEVSNIDSKLIYLSKLDDPKISFFSDLKLASIDNLEKYEKLDKDILILKKTLIDSDIETLRTLSLDDDFIFRDIARIYFLNFEPKNLDIIYSNHSETIDNFFLKAVKRYYNEIN